MNKFIYIRNLIQEALSDEHFIDRFNQRFLETKEVFVCIKNNTGFQRIGTYVIPNDIKSNILSEIKIIQNYNFPKTKSYAVKMSQIPIDKNNVKYASEQLKLECKSKVLLLEVGATSERGSIGTVPYVIVRLNKLDTFMFYENLNYTPSKFDVDVITSMNAILKRTVHESF